MHALVVGGTGGMGQGVARDLIKQEQIEKVILGDINTDPGRVQEKLRASEKISLVRIDVNDHARHGGRHQGCGRGHQLRRAFLQDSRGGSQGGR